MTSLAFDQVKVEYAKRTAVASFTDTVKPGEWLCIIGPNGAGKSSLLRAIAGVVPHSGRILVDGSPLTARSSRRRAQLVAYVPQSPVLPSGMTGAEYVLLGRNPFVTHFGRESELDHSMVDDVIDRLDLAKLATRDVDTLSGGERQRLVIARAIAQEAPILLLDEPTAGMTHDDVERVVALVKRVSVGRTVLLVEPNLRVVQGLCDTITVLARGSVLAEGDYAAVSRNPDVIAAYLGSEAPTEAAHG